MGQIAIEITNLEAILENNPENEYELDEISSFEEELKRLTNIQNLWDAFGNVPMNPETECIEQDWNGFPAGTFREDIWHWFEETFDISVAEDLMYSKYPE